MNTKLVKTKTVGDCTIAMNSNMAVLVGGMTVIWYSVSDNGGFEWTFDTKQEAVRFFNNFVENEERKEEVRKSHATNA